MHTPDDPTPAAKRRPTYTHPGTVSATQTCSAAIHGPWTHLMIANQIQEHHTQKNKNWGLLEGLGEQVGFQL